MPDPSSQAALTIAETGDVLSPSVTADAFAQLPLVKQGMIRHLGGGETRIAVGRYTIAGQLFDIKLQFQGPRLTRIELFALTNDEGASWDDWTLEREMNRKRLHESWAQKKFGKPLTVRPFFMPHRIEPAIVTEETARYAQHDWGQVCSWYDSKGGFAYMTVDYGATDPA